MKLSRTILYSIVLIVLVSCDDKLNWIPEPPPKINAITPDSGKAGHTVIIEGEGFSKKVTENKVTFNNSIAEVSAASSSGLTVTVPESTTGPVVVTVTGRGASNKFTFTYEE